MTVYLAASICDFRRLGMASVLFAVKYRTTDIAEPHSMACTADG